MQQPFIPPAPAYNPYAPPPGTMPPAPIPYTPPPPTAPAPGTRQMQNPPVPAPWRDGGVPSWEAMTMGRQKSPLLDFIGTFSRFDTEVDNFERDLIHLYFTNLQVYNVEGTFTDAEAVITVSFSRSWNSGFGKLGKSFADLLGIDPKTFNVNLILHGSYRMVRTPDEVFGQNRQSGEVMKGDVWRAVQIMSAPGVAPVALPVAAPVAPPVPPMPPVAPPAAPGLPPAGMALPPTPPMPPTVAPMPPAASVAPSINGQPPPPTPTALVVTPEQRALELLDGKDLGTFWNMAMQDPIIKANQPFMQSIMDRSFIASQMTAGRVVENANGTYTVKPTA